MHVLLGGQGSIVNVGLWVRRLARLAWGWWLVWDLVCPPLEVARGGWSGIPPLEVAARLFLVGVMVRPAKHG